MVMTRCALRWNYAPLDFSYAQYHYVPWSIWLRTFVVAIFVRVIGAAQPPLERLNGQTTSNTIAQGTSQ